MPAVGNLGDDLISAVLVQNILQKYPKAEIGILYYTGTNYFEYPSGYNIKLLYYPLFKDLRTFIQRQIILLKFISSANYILIGGGGLIQDTHGNYTINRYFQFAFNYFSRKAKVLLVGVGIGPLKRILSKDYFQTISKRCSAIQVRDKHSASYLLDYSSPVIISPDIVSGSNQLASFGFQKLDSNNNALGCSIRPWKSLSFEQISSFIYKVCEEYKLSCNLFVFEYEKWQQEEYDYAIRLQDYLKSKGILTTVFCYAKDPWGDFLQAFCSVKYAIATRFHANILWQKLNIKVIPISYAPKVKSLYEEKGGQVIPIDNIAPLSISGESVFQKIDLSDEYVFPDLEGLTLNKPSIGQHLLVIKNTFLHTWETFRRTIKKRIFNKKIRYD